MRVQERRCHGPSGNHYGKQVPGKDGLGENDGSGRSGRTGKGTEKGIQHRGQDP